MISQDFRSTGRYTNKRCKEKCWMKTKEKYGNFSEIESKMFIISHEERPLFLENFNSSVKK
jgi:hypothetical protein